MSGIQLGWGVTESVMFVRSEVDEVCRDMVSGKCLKEVGGEWMLATGSAVICVVIAKL